MEDAITVAYRKVLAVANAEAQRYGRPRVGAEHLMFALARTAEDRRDAHGLATIGVAPYALVDELRRLLVAEPGLGPMGRLPRTPQAERAIRRAEHAARDQGWGGPSPAHLLLGLLSEGDGVAAGALTTLGIDRERALVSLAEHLRTVDRDDARKPSPGAGDDASWAADDSAAPTGGDRVTQTTHTWYDEAGRVVMQVFDRPPEIRTFTYYDGGDDVAADVVDPPATAAEPTPWRVCPDCGGEGRVTLLVSTRPCDTCRGTGRVGP